MNPFQVWINHFPALDLPIALYPERKPWAGTQYGHGKNGGHRGDTNACQRNNPAFVRTRHGSMKRKKARR